MAGKGSAALRSRSSSSIIHSLPSTVVDRFAQDLPASVEHHEAHGLTLVVGVSPAPMFVPSSSRTRPALDQAGAESVGTQAHIDN